MKPTLSPSGSSLDNITVRIFEAFCAAANESTHTSNITMATIARKLKISKPDLYKHFQNVNKIIDDIHYYVNTKPKKYYLTT